MAYGYLFIVSILTVHAEDYFMSEVSSEWLKKDNVCLVAIPPIKHTINDISVEINSNLIETGDAWVGYTRTQRLFDYIGCFKKDNFQPESVLVGSPGQCFAICNHGSLIGLSVNECFCIKDSSSLAYLRTFLTNCTKECELQSGVACGGHVGNGTKYMSVYKDTQLNENITSDNDEDSYCLRLDRVKRMFIWTQCFKELLVFCDFNGTCIATSSPGTNKSWIESANSCFFNGGFPLRTKNCKENNSSKYPDSVWTSFIRSNVINTSSNQSVSVDSGIQYGYVRRQGGEITLEFTKDGSKEKMVLCNSQHVQNIKDNDKSNLLIFIAIIVAAVLPIVLIIICTVVLWRRRKCKQRHKRNNIPHYDGPVISFITNANYAHVDDIISHTPASQDSDVNQRIEGIHGQIYDVDIQDSGNALEATCKTEGHDNHPRTYDRIEDVNCKLAFGNKGDTQSRGDNVVHNYYILEKQNLQETQSNYDKTGISKKTPKECDANIYNKLEFEKEQTYDHAFQNKPNVFTAIPDTYNTIAAVHSSTKI